MEDVKSQTVLFLHIQVVFIGEVGEDGGGPRKELWCLFGLSLKGTYFEGKARKLLPRHATVALQVCLDMQEAYMQYYLFICGPSTHDQAIVCTSHAFSHKYATCSNHTIIFLVLGIP